MTARYINSYSIFFSGYGYWDMVPLLVRQHHLFYDDKWEFVLHHDRADLSTLNYGKALMAMHDERIIRLVYVSDVPILCKAMLWRLLPIWNSDSEYTFCRDADSLLTMRQKLCVDAFLTSNKLVHGINDNPAHNIPLMGGMFGCRNKDISNRIGLNSLSDLYNLVDYSDEKWAQRGADQELLNSKIWPKFMNDSLIHNFNIQKDVEYDNSTKYNKDLYEKDRVFSNYIGACGLKQKIESAVEFYEKYIRNDILNKIKDIENACADDIYLNNIYNQ